MSRRAHHKPRVETSLELKCLLLFSLSLLVVISVSFWLCWMVPREVVNNQNPQMAGLMADQAFLINHGLFFELDNEHKSEYLQYLSEELRHQNFESRIIRLPNLWSADPAENDRPQDIFEKDMLKEFLDVPADADPNSPEYSWMDRISTNEGDEYYQYYQAIRAKPSCLSSFCHSASGFEPTVSAEGDLMAVMHVTYPNQYAQELIKWSWSWLMGASIITACLALMAFYLVVRYLIIRPLRHLQDVSEEISRGGDMTQRADIRTGDEFESLATAFNRMLRHLMTVQDELKSTNVDLDSKVDQLARVNVQLYENNRLKSDFMATMSHELRTPLNSILGFSDVLGSISTLDEKQKRYVENINKSGRVLLDMINDVLDLAKIEAGSGEVNLSEFQIARLIEAQCDMARSLADKKNLDIEILVERTLPPMLQDESRLQQVINNLLSNAIKFTPEGGHITVMARRKMLEKFDVSLHEVSDLIQPSELVLQVRDTGIGISESDQSIIFEKFRQGETAMPGGSAMTREHSGTGLGLSIVKEICKLLCGEVGVKSQLGAGSTFSVQIPWRLKKADPKEKSSGGLSTSQKKRMIG